MLKKIKTYTVIDTITQEKFSANSKKTLKSILRNEYLKLSALDLIDNSWYSNSKLFWTEQFDVGNVKAFKFDKKNHIKQSLNLTSIY